MGKIVRIMALPDQQSDAAPRRGVSLGSDFAGHLVYRAPAPVYLAMVPFTWTGDTLLSAPDSFPILRYDLTSRQVDTLVSLKAPRAQQHVARPANGVGGRGMAAINPYPSGDAWVIMPNGSVGIVRAHDFHVDWVHPDKSITSMPPIPFHTRRLTDSVKVAMIDSLRTADSVVNYAAYRRDSISYDSLMRATGGVPIRGGRGAGPRMPYPMRQAFVLPDALPDYVPAILPGAFADADGNIWVTANEPLAPGSPPVYDVISSKGTLIDRVQIPGGTTLRGFGPGVAYLSARVGNGLQLAKARIRF